MASQKRPVAMITGGTRGIGSGIYIWYKVLLLRALYIVVFSGIAEMFAEDGYDLILGFRENVSAAEKFKIQLLEKYQSQNVSTYNYKLKNNFMLKEYLVCISCWKNFYFIVEYWTNSRQYIGRKDHYNLFWDCR